MVHIVFATFLICGHLRVTEIFHSLYLVNCKTLKGESQDLVISYALLRTVQGKGNKNETWNVERRRHLFF